MSAISNEELFYLFDEDYMQDYIDSKPNILEQYIMMYPESIWDTTRTELCQNPNLTKKILKKLGYALDKYELKYSGINKTFKYHKLKKFKSPIKLNQLVLTTKEAEDMLRNYHAAYKKDEYFHLDWYGIATNPGVDIFSLFKIHEDHTHHLMCEEILDHMLRNPSITLDSIVKDLRENEIINSEALCLNKFLYDEFYCVLSINRDIARRRKKIKITFEIIAKTNNEFGTRIMPVVGEILKYVGYD